MVGSAVLLDLTRMCVFSVSSQWTAQRSYFLNSVVNTNTWSMGVQPAQGREIQILSIVWNKDLCRASREFFMKKFLEDGRRSKKNLCDLYFVEYEGFPEDHWIWELSTRFQRVWFAGSSNLGSFPIKKLSGSWFERQCAQWCQTEWLQKKKASQVSEKVVCLQSGQRFCASASPVPSLWWE